jgi:phytol kinase
MLRDVRSIIKVDETQNLKDDEGMNWWGVVLSFLYVFLFIGVAQLLLTRGRMSAAVTRKVVHIGVAHWWLLAMVFFDRWQFAIIGPVAFILINLASYLIRLFPAMEHEKRSRNLGTIYFPISLAAAVLLTWAGPVPIWVGAVAILVMGWGDGLASLVGEHTGGPSVTIFGNTKSLAGSLTMFVAATLVAWFFIRLFATPEFLIFDANLSPFGSIIITAASVGLVATVVEAVTPFGLDNLTVPGTVLAFLWLI